VKTTYHIVRMKAGPQGRKAEEFQLAILYREEESTRLECPDALLERKLETHFQTPIRIYETRGDEPVLFSLRQNLLEPPGEEHFQEALLALSALDYLAVPAG